MSPGLISQSMPLPTVLIYGFLLLWDCRCSSNLIHITWGNLNACLWFIVIPTCPRINFLILPCNQIWVLHKQRGRVYTFYHIYNKGILYIYIYEYTFIYTYIFVCVCFITVLLCDIWGNLKVYSLSIYMYSISSFSLENPKRLALERVSLPMHNHTSSYSLLQLLVQSSFMYSLLQHWYCQLSVLESIFSKHALYSVSPHFVHDMWLNKHLWSLVLDYFHVKLENMMDFHLKKL